MLLSPSAKAESLKKASQNVVAVLNQELIQDDTILPAGILFLVNQPLCSKCFPESTPYRLYSRLLQNMIFVSNCCSSSCYINVLKNRYENSYRIYMNFKMKTIFLDIFLNIRLVLFFFTIGTFIMASYFKTANLVS